MEDFHINIATANGFLELQMLDEAANTLEEIAPELKTQAEVLEVRAKIYYRLSKWEDMATVGKYLAAHYPEDPSHYLTYASAVRFTDSVEAAFEILHSVAGRFPDDALFQFTLGAYESLLGQFKRAFHHISRAIELDRSMALRALDDPDIKPLWDAMGEVNDDAN